MKNIYKLLKKIPKGKVSTYKSISNVTGIHPRALGKILSLNKNTREYPCYKIVRSNGEIGGYKLGKKKKELLLKKDGIEIKKGRINLKKHMYEF